MRQVSFSGCAVILCLWILPVWGWAGDLLVRPGFYMPWGALGETFHSGPLWEAGVGTAASGRLSWEGTLGLAFLSGRSDREVHLTLIPFTIGATYRFLTLSPESSVFLRLALGAYGTRVTAGKGSERAVDGGMKVGLGLESAWSGNLLWEVCVSNHIVREQEGGSGGLAAGVGLRIRRGREAS